MMPTGTGKSGAARATPRQLRARARRAARGHKEFADIVVGDSALPQRGTSGMRRAALVTRVGDGYVELTLPGPPVKQWEMSAARFHRQYYVAAKRR